MWICPRPLLASACCHTGKGSPYSIAKHRVPELIPILGSKPAGDVSHKPGGRLPLLFARPAVAPATLKRAATNLLLAEQRHDSVAAAIGTQALLCLSLAC